MLDQGKAALAVGSAEVDLEMKVRLAYHNEDLMGDVVAAAQAVIHARQVYALARVHLAINPSRVADPTRWSAYYDDGAPVGVLLSDAAFDEWQAELAGRIEDHA